MNEPTRLKPSQEFIRGLINSFPCLRNKFTKFDWSEFDSYKVWEMSGPWSHGERLSLQFCLNVWSGNCKSDPFYPFNVLEFISIADSGNKRAMMAWIEKPYWP